MKKVLNLLMVLLFVSAMVSCGGNAETEAPTEDTVDTTTAPAEDMAGDSTTLDSTDVKTEEDHGDHDH